jgi:hypothetical protein
MGIQIAARELQKNLDNLDTQVVKAMRTVFSYWATQAVSQMRTNAAWTDRTGNARNGLRADVEDSGNKISLVLYHSVPYGIWLEVRWSGRYAVIQPTLQSVGPKLMNMLSQVVLQSSRPA